MSLVELQERIGYTFGQERLLVQALTHKSYAQEHGVGAHYERLEYLGDSVLQILATHLIFELFPDSGEGFMSTARSKVVREPTLAQVARELNIGAELRLGKGEEKSNGRDKPKILADSFEAILGAMYLDSGCDLGPPRILVRSAFLHRLSGDVAAELLREPRGDLQVTSMARWKVMPTYAVIEEPVVSENKGYVMEVRINSPFGLLVESAEGRSKQLAATEAAKRLLEMINRDFPTDESEPDTAVAQEPHPEMSQEPQA